MKRIILTIIICFFTCLSAKALNVTMESLCDVNSQTDNTEFSAKILKDAEFDSGFKFKKYSVVYFDIEQIVPAKFGKRSAYMVIKPVSITDEENWKEPIEENNIEGKTVSVKIIKKPVINKETIKKNVKSAGKAAGVKALNTALPGSAQIYQLSKGLLIPEEGKTRLQSAAGNLVDNSALKHLKSGDNLDIKQGEILVVDFYRSDIPKYKFLKRRK